MADEPKHAGPSDGRRWVTGVIVGIVIVVVAAAGVAAGRLTAPAPPAAVATGPVIEESPEAEPLAVGQPPVDAEGADLTGTQRPTLFVASSSSGGPAVVMSAGGDLPDTPGVAPGYRSVNAGISGAQVAAILATTFGVTGSPVQSAQGWTVGPSAGKLLIVDDNPLFTWRFTDTPASGKPATGPPIDSDRAIDLVGALLGGIGVDTDSVDWQVDRYEGMTVVTAWQTLGRSRTSLSWQVGLAPDGTLIRASGFSAGLDPVAAYPVVGAREAVQRTAQPGWGALVPRLVSVGESDDTTESVPATSEGATPSPAASTAPASSSTSALPNPSLTVPITTVTAERADLDLAQYWQADGSLLILPTYLVTGADGSRWTVLAIDDTYVDFLDIEPRSALQ